jgi:hypothetical protein
MENLSGFQDGADLKTMLTDAVLVGQVWVMSEACLCGICCIGWQMMELCRLCGS